MTLELRRQHRRAFAVLALLLPGALALSLTLRAPIPDVRLSSELRAPAEQHGPVVWTSYTLWPEEKVVTRLRRNEAGAVALELSWRDFTRPDLLLYWAPGTKQTLEQLPPAGVPMGGPGERGDGRRSAADPAGAPGLQSGAPGLQSGRPAGGAAGGQEAVEELPPDARFIGAVQMGRPIPIPGAIRGEAGTLILYSLAAQEIAAVSSGFILQKI